MRRHPFLQWNAIAALAASADVLKGYDDPLAKDCLETAIKAWNDEKAHPTLNPAGGLGGSAPVGAPGGGVLAASQGVVSDAHGVRNGRGSSGAPTSYGATSTQTAPPAGLGRGGFGVGQEWAAALELTTATNGAEPYKSRLKELLPQIITPQRMGVIGWTAVRALPYLDASAKDQVRDAVKTYVAGLEQAVGRLPIRRAPEPSHLGRLGRRG